MTRLDEAVAGNREVLAQAADLLVRLSDADYSVSGGVPGRSPIGAHMRHLLDHYRAFFTGLERGRVDYEARDRESAVEHDRHLAHAEVTRWTEALEAFAAAPADRPLRVNLRSLADSDTREDWSDSTLKRELQFLVSHSVHHFAIIRTRLTDLGIDPGDEFGMAPSTIAAQRREAAGAPGLAAR